MKLIAKAKPVRFRIKSGGVEHNSLESLREYFCFEDILPLLDESRRLSRWLVSIGRDDVARRLDRLNLSPDRLKQMLQVYNVLFSPARQLETLDDMLAAYDRKEISRGLVRKAITVTNVPNLLRINNKRSFFDKYPDLVEDIFVSYFEKEKETAKADELYEIGKFLFEHGTHNAVGVECIRESSNKGFDTAKVKLAEYGKSKTGRN